MKTRSIKQIIIKSPLQRIYTHHLLLAKLLFHRDCFWAYLGKNQVKSLGLKAYLKFKIVKFNGIKTNFWKIWVFLLYKINLSIFMLRFISFEDNHHLNSSFMNYILLINYLLITFSLVTPFLKLKNYQNYEIQ